MNLIGTLGLLFQEQLPARFVRNQNKGLLSTTASISIISLLRVKKHQNTFTKKISYVHKFLNAREFLLAVTAKKKKKEEKNVRICTFRTNKSRWPHFGETLKFEKSVRDFFDFFYFHRDFSYLIFWWKICDFLIFLWFFRYFFSKRRTRFFRVIYPS